MTEPKPKVKPDESKKALEVFCDVCVEDVIPRQEYRGGNQEVTVCPNCNTNLE